MSDGRNTPPQLIIVGNAREHRPEGKIPYDTRAWVYDPGGIAPTLKATDYKDPRLILERIPIMQQNTDRVMQIGNTTENAKRENPQPGRVYNTEGLSPTLVVSGGGNHEPQILEPVTCAMRGRNPDNPSDRTSGIPTEQRIELGGDIANCITTVQKDSLVAEPQAIGHYRPEGLSGDIPYGDYELRPKTDGIANAVTAQPGGKDLLIAEAVSHIIASEQKHAYVGSTDSVSPCHTEAMGSGGGNVPMVTEPTIRAVGNIYPSGGQGGKVVDPDGIAPTVCENHGEVTRIIEDPIKIRQATKQGYIECPTGGCFDANYPDSKLRRGRVQENGTVSPTLTAQGEPPWLNEGRVCAYKEMPDGSIRGYNPNTADKRGISEEQYASPDAIAPTVTTAHEPKILEPMVSAHPLSHAHENPQPQVDVAPTLRATDYKCPPVAYEPFPVAYRIRKLTPKECFRLMDVDDPDIDKIINAKNAKGKPAVSKSQCYKLAGNSIVVACLLHIFENLFYPKNEQSKQPQLF